MRLLIIEDELPVAETLRDFLQEEGHDVPLDYLAKPFSLDRLVLVLQVLEVALFPGNRQAPSLFI